MPSDALSRASFYFDQERYSEARAELLRALEDDPADGSSRSLLALCHWYLGAKKKALEEAKAAVAVSPESSDAHRILAWVHLQLDHSKISEREALEAVRLDPEDPNAHSVLAAVYGSGRRWKLALESAERGLQCDPNHATCASQRALAMGMLGKKGHAREAAREAIAEDPEEAHSHEVAGWVHLRDGDVKGAMPHFVESLRLDPHSESAREGLLHALRSSFPLYRWMIQYSLWIDGLPGSSRWMATFGLFILVRVFVRITKDSPGTRPVAYVVGVAYALFVLTMFLGPGLLNMVLLMNPLGRIALTRQERIEASWTAGMLAAAAILGLGAFSSLGVKMGGPAALLGLFGLLLALTARLSDQKFRKGLFWFLVILGIGLTAVLTVAGLLSSNPA